MRDTLKPPPDAATAPSPDVIDRTFTVGLGLRPALLFALIFVPLAIPLAIGVGIATKSLGLPISPGIPGAICGGGAMLFVPWAIVRRARVRFHKRIARTTHVVLDEDDRAHRQQTVLLALEDTARRYGPFALVFGGRSSLLQICARELASLGAHGQVLRLAPMPLDPVGPALDMPFEPTPLRDVRPGFLDLQGRTISSGERFRVFWRQLGQAFVGRPWVQRTFLLGVTVGFVVMIVQTIRGVLALMQGRYSADLNFLLLFAVLIPAIIAYRAMQIDRWYLVPGGLIVIGPRMWSTWTTRLLRRHENVVLCLTQLNSVVVANPDGFSDARALTPWELEMFLRAWRSPLPPPSEDLVQSLLSN